MAPKVQFSGGRPVVTTGANSRVVTVPGKRVVIDDSDAHCSITVENKGGLVVLPASRRKVVVQGGRKVVEVVTPGPIGPTGKQIVHGEGPPPPGTGRQDDFYIDTQNWDLWGPKLANGSWGVPVSLVGPAGPAGTIEIGEVTTGDPGTPASVTNVGTSTNAVLNMVIPKGDKGDVGPASTGVTYVYDQATPSTVWTVNHNLHQHPSVTTVDSAGTTIFGQIEYVSDDTVVIYFSVPSGGRVYLN